MTKRKRARHASRPRATTSDIVGASPGKRNARVPVKWRKHYQHLLKLREDLLKTQGQLAKSATEESPTYSSHMADAGTDTYDRDLALSMLSSEQSALYEIDQALDRIRNGSYGKCEITGKPIDARRLEVIPWARYNVSAGKQLEAEGAKARARLGPRQPVPKSSAGEEEDDESET